METDLKSLRIDRNRKRPEEGSKWATRWIVAGVTIILLLGAARFVFGKLNASTEVETVRVTAHSTGSTGGGDQVILNATGYIVAAHKIQVASKVLGRVAWIGVDKGDRVREGQVIVRLEDDEYRAQLQQAKGQLLALEARLAELETGSRPEEIARARAEVESARADMENARIELSRTQQLVDAGVVAKQRLDEAQARFDSQKAKVAALERSSDLIRIGPRKEQIDAMRGQLVQARGAVDFYQTQLSNTVIRAPVTGTILERAVEKGEFVTTSFVGERGAKGYVVSLADLSDLEVELDINQNDFAKLGHQQKGMVTVDAFPDRKYKGIIGEISPEANRQKATVQVKVKVLNPDEYLRPEMNASVAFYEEQRINRGNEVSASHPVLYVPASAVRNDAVFVLHAGRAVRRPVKTAGTTSQGVRVEEGLIGGEDVIINPPADLKDGSKVKRKEG